MDARGDCFKSMERTAGSPKLMDARYLDDDLWI